MKNIIDSVVGFISPKAGFRRAQFRSALESQVRRYEGAAEGRRHANWMGRENPSVNQLINKDHANLLVRARQLAINNPYAKRAPNTISNNVIGTGIIPTPYVVSVIKDGKIIKNSKETAIIEAATAAWKDWAENIKCDYDGNHTLYGMQSLSMVTAMKSGEVLAIRKRVTSDVNKYGLQILLLEADYIDQTKQTDKDIDGGYTFYGIKYDSKGKRTGYWIFDRHPSEGNAKSTLVDIKDIAHVYDVDRPGQNRGVPAAASTILKQRDVDDYEDAELLGKKAQACHAIFVTNASPESDSDNEKVENLEPGAVNYLNSGETVTMSAPPASTGFTDFIRTQHRAIAAGYLMPYEAFTGDYSNVNFSSGRMGYIEFSRQVDKWQYLMFIPKFCDVIFGWFIEQFSVVASLPKEIEIKATWTAPRREMIDPVKETSAMRTMTRAGFQSWSETVRQAGFNPDDVLKELAADFTKFKEAGIMFDWTPEFEMLALAQKQSGNKDTPTKDKK